MGLAQERLQRCCKTKTLDFLLPETGREGFPSQEESLDKRELTKGSGKGLAKVSPSPGCVTCMGSPNCALKKDALHTCVPARPQRPSSQHYHIPCPRTSLILTLALLEKLHISILQAGKPRLHEIVQGHNVQTGWSLGVCLGQ